MIQIDCETQSSAMDSLSKIYNITTQEIESFFESFDLDLHCQTNETDGFGDQELRNVFEKRTGCSPNKIDRVCWFHLTRTLHNEEFKDGIFPLTSSLEKVWLTVLNIFKDSKHVNNLETLSKNGVSDFQYNLKTGEALHGGPFAMLIKEVAYKPNEIGSHDYLWLPEIMEDICNGYEKSFGCSLHAQLSDSLKPKIIKFWSENKTNSSCIESALYYSYLRSRKKPLTHIANTCYDGNNIKIQPEQIMQVVEANA